MPAIRYVRPLRGGQITIPKEFRDATGFDDSDMIAVALEADGNIVLSVVKGKPKGQGSPWMKELYDLFAPAREGMKGLTEDEVNAEIDAAIAEVRAEHAKKR